MGSLNLNISALANGISEFSMVYESLILAILFSMLLLLFHGYSN
jgi:hypothetical protein